MSPKTFAAALLASLCWQAAGAVTLITEAEARLPNVPGLGTLATRAITRAPAIAVISPDPADPRVRSPFSLRVSFKAHGGARVDLTHLRLTYLKTPSVDLVERIKEGLSEQGIQLAGVEAPVGEHNIRLVIRDSEGREAGQIIRFTVVE